ncbi:MAG: penicillin-binding protein 2 [Hyphomicrobiaceae bacterium]
MIKRLLPRRAVGLAARGLAARGFARPSGVAIRGGGLVIRDGDQEEREAAVSFRRRGLLIGLAHAAAFGALGSRLYQLQVLEAVEIAGQALDNRTRIIPTAPMRGRIVDAAGNVLAANREVFRILVIPEPGGDLRDLRPLLGRLAPMVGLSHEDQERLFAKARGQARHIPLLVSEGVTFEQVAALQLRASDLPGVRAETIWVRSYPAREREAHSMAHIVGYVGAVDRRALDDDPILRLADARVGKAGVEAGMETELRGVGGQVQIEVDARSRFVRRVSETAPLAGRDVRLTVDTKLQMQVMDRLARDGRPGACVVLDCVTGEVRVMASTPTFDAGRLSGVQSKAAWQAVASNPDKPLLNRAIAGQYPPGSTFKMVTALAGLEAGLLTVKEKIECWGDVTIAGHVFRCWNRKGHITSDLHKALRESCDCYFYEVARRVGMEAIAVKARELGLGQTYDAGISQQKAGLIPTPGWKRNRSKTGWLLGETVMAGIGQGYVLATPLQLAVMTARIATGRAVTPTLVARPEGDPDPQFATMAIAPAALEAVRKAMVGVVNEPGGTGQAADIDDGEMVIAGKTGTSQVSRASADRDRSTALDLKQRDHALFVAFLPAGKPRYAVAVVLEHAGGGGTMAGPLVRDVVAMLVEGDKHLARTEVPLAGDGPVVGEGAGKRAEVR